MSEFNIKDYLDEFKETIEAKFTHTHARLDVLNDDIREVKELQKVANGRLRRAEEEIDETKKEVSNQVMTCKFVQDSKRSWKSDIKYIFTTLVAIAAIALAFLR